MSVQFIESFELMCDFAKMGQWQPTEYVYLFSPLFSHVLRIGVAAYVVGAITIR